MSLIHLAAHVLASAGGGGSGGGGGGGGGGSIILLIGYLPTHFLGSLFRKYKLQTVGNFITWPAAALYGALLIIIFRGIGAYMALAALIGAGAGLYGWWGKLKRNRRAEANLKAAASLDSTWDPETLKTYTGQVLERFQYDWSRFDTESMKQYLTPKYHYHISLMMYALQLASRTNRMSDVRIVEQHITSVSDNADDAHDSFVMGYEVEAKDEIVDSVSGEVIFKNPSPFVEYWTFERSDNTWLLAGITPSTASMGSQNLTVKQFAEQNNLCYSLDWGWLLLPRRGQIFGKGKFGVSDINNHVIGMYKDLLIQIYTYAPVAAQATKDQYLIAQAQLPKSYGDIVLRRKKGWSLFHRAPRGLRKIELEWPDFNRKYDVLASTAEGPTSFELLHPAFMEVLERQPFEVNLEVVDNVVYFYTKETALQPEHYPAFLAILQEAFKQMRL